jgi:hypothetical protein
VLILSAIAFGLLSGSADIAGAIANAQHRPVDFFKINLLRTGVTFLMCFAAMAIMRDETVAAAAYALGGASVALSAWFRQIIKQSRFRRVDPEAIRLLFGYGIAAGLAFSFYIMFHAVGRFYVSESLGVDNAGRLALAADVFYAPTALILGTAGLSFMPRMHQGRLDGGLAVARPWMERYLATQFLFSGPILVAGWYLGPWI